MDVHKAAQNTWMIVSKNCMQAPIPERSEDAKGLGHAAFILQEIIDRKIFGEKAHRWLGYAQGLLVAEGAASLNDCKYANVFS